MALKTFKPYTKSTRGTILVDRSHLWKGKSEKTLTKKMHRAVGRNNQGRITSRHRSAGHKKKYRKIDFIRNYDSIGIVTSIEYDPYRTAFIASVYDLLNHSYFYMIAPKNLKIGHIVKSGSNAEPKLGHSLLLTKIPVGSFIHNISIKKII